MRLAVLMFCFLVPAAVFAQDVVPKPDVVAEVSESKFRRAMLKAAGVAAQKGEIRRLDVIKLRVASLSPAFLVQAQRLAVVQMAFSGDEVPTDADGKIEVSRIDWESLITFLERLIPLILKLIDLFAFGGGAYHAYC